MTRTEPWRRITLHFSHIFLTDGRTFTLKPLSSWSGALLVAVRDTATGQVIGSELDLHLVSWEDPDVVHPHLSGDMGEDFVSVLELDAEHRVGKWFNHGSLNEDRVILGLGYGAPPGSGRAEKRAEVLRDDLGI